MPRGAPKQTVGVRLTADDIAALDRLAQAREMTRSQWLALAIRRVIDGEREAALAAKQNGRGGPTNRVSPQWKKGKP